MLQLYRAAWAVYRAISAGSACAFRGLLVRAQAAARDVAPALSRSWSGRTRDSGMVAQSLSRKMARAYWALQTSVMPVN